MEHVSYVPVFSDALNVPVWRARRKRAPQGNVALKSHDFSYVSTVGYASAYPEAPNVGLASETQQNRAICACESKMSAHRKRLREPCRYTLTELEEHDWGPPTSDSSLVQAVHRLRNVPLNDLAIGDLRLMIGQSVGLRYLVPIALDELTTDPLADGGHYAGDLLNAVIGIPPNFWENSGLASRAVAIAQTALDAIDAALLAKI